VIAVGNGVSRPERPRQLFCVNAGNEHAREMPRLHTYHAPARFELISRNWHAPPRRVELRALAVRLHAGISNNKHGLAIYAVRAERTLKLHP